jgi:hypothetical protein
LFFGKKGWSGAKVAGLSRHREFFFCFIKKLTPSRKVLQESPLFAETALPPQGSVAGCAGLLSASGFSGFEDF